MSDVLHPSEIPHIDDFDFGMLSFCARSKLQFFYFKCSSLSAASRFCNLRMAPASMFISRVLSPSVLVPSWRGTAPTLYSARNISLLAVLV